MVVPHTRQLQSGASAQLLTLDGGDLVWCAGADTHLALGPRFQASAGMGSARLAEGGGLPTKVRLTWPRILDFKQVRLALKWGQTCWRRHPPGGVSSFPAQRWHGLCQTGRGRRPARQGTVLSRLRGVLRCHHSRVWCTAHICIRHWGKLLSSQLSHCTPAGCRALQRMVQSSLLSLQVLFVNEAITAAAGLLVCQCDCPSQCRLC